MEGGRSRGRSKLDRRILSLEDPQYILVVLEEDADETQSHSAAVFKQLCEEFHMLGKEKAD